MTYIFLRSASDFELNAISMLSKDIWGCVFIQTGIKGCYIWVDLNNMIPGILILISSRKTYGSSRVQIYQKNPYGLILLI